MSKWIYKGPVMVYITLASSYRVGETIADSKKKAKSNLAYQFKQIANRSAATRVTLPGVLTEVK